MSKDLIDLSSFSKMNYYSSRCEHCLFVIPNKHCPKFMECPYQRQCKANTVINTYDTVKEREIVFYKKPFFKNTGVITERQPDRSRKFIVNEDGYRVPKDDIVSLLDFNKTKCKSKKRALDNTIGFCTNGSWNYFITLTFSSAKLDRLDDSAVKYAWQKFRQKLQYYYPDIEIFVVNERHSKGGIHLHGFMGKCDLTKYLRIAINTNMWRYTFIDNEKVLLRDKEGNLIKNKYYMQPLLNSFGEQVYNLDPKIYDEGYLTLVKIRPDTSNAQITNYITKYISKDYILSNQDSKMYYRTHNLKPKKKESKFLTREEFEDLVMPKDILDYQTTYVKENDKLISVRQKLI